MKTNIWLDVEKTLISFKKLEDKEIQKWRSKRSSQKWKIPSNCYWLVNLYQEVQNCEIRQNARKWRSGSCCVVKSLKQSQLAAEIQRTQVMSFVRHKNAAFS